MNIYLDLARAQSEERHREGDRQRLAAQAEAQIRRSQLAARR